ncbi:MAG: DUF2235 domain-containing protein [Acidobacteriota bacterium]|nr:DUF2235 domain-containing protein [Acidobacteriota bacterium]
MYKLFKSLTTTADQIPLYDDGVGSVEDPFLHFVGGAFGTGLWQKIKEGYTKIAHLYEAGDPLFLFGFSRGAYTARSLAGMIAACGLPTKDFSDDMVETAFKAYREKDNREKLLETLKDHNMFPAKITMVGVWDTVGSLGIPSVAGVTDPILYGFLDTALHPDVLNAYHAIAIDEKRLQFPATLWSSPSAGQTLEQVWFTGVHSDIGGGEPDDLPGATALSDITLAWMMSKAIALGLELDPTVAQMYAIPLTPEYALDKLHSSWNVLKGFPKPRSIPPNSAIANSVAVRCEHDHSYRPSNLKFENGVLSSSYALATVVSEPEAADQVEQTMPATGR